MRWAAVLLSCGLGLAFGACGLSPTPDLPSAADETDAGNGFTGGSGAGGPALASGGTANGAPNAMAGAAGSAGFGGETP